MTRYLEINSTGMAFHEPDPLTMFVDNPPPKEVLFCDCQGVGRICHHVYAGDPTHPDPLQHKDRHYDITGAKVTPKSQDDFRAMHTGPRHVIRRQFFVDVTDRPDAQLGMHYDEKTDTFSKA